MEGVKLWRRTACVDVLASLRAALSSIRSRFQQQLGHIQVTHGGNKVQRGFASLVFGIYVCLGIQERLSIGVSGAQGQLVANMDVFLQETRLQGPCASGAPG